MAGKMEWHRIAGHESEVFESLNGIAVITCADKKICIARYQDQLFAFAYLCPHASGIMANGHIDPLGNIVCPVHRYKFSISNGRNVSGEGYHLKTYPLESRPDGFYLGIEKTNWLGF